MDAATTSESMHGAPVIILINFLFDLFIFGVLRIVCQLFCVLFYLQLLRAIHSLWSPSVSQTLPVEVKAAMNMSDVERFSLFGEGNPKSSKGAPSFANGFLVNLSKEGHTEANETDIRNWLKGIRDSG